MNPNVIPMHDLSSNCEIIQAEVKSISDDRIVIRTNRGVVNATRAFSCVISPCVDDVVLISCVANRFHLLSILERPTASVMNIEFPGDAYLCSKEGKLNLSAKDGIDITTPAKAGITSTEINMAAANIGMQSNVLKAAVTDIEVLSKTTKLSVSVLQVVAKQISQKTDVVMRWVETVETLSIGSLVQNIRSNFILHSDQTVITAKKDMRIDAERIHMG
jgi:hypothetical protein